MYFVALVSDVYRFKLLYIFAELSIFSLSSDFISAKAFFLKELFKRENGAEGENPQADST